MGLKEGYSDSLYETVSFYSYRKEITAGVRA